MGIPFPDRWPRAIPKRAINRFERDLTKHEDWYVGVSANQNLLPHAAD